jgi:trans-L-3-hydroxyproline dehydratase
MALVMPLVMALASLIGWNACENLLDVSAASTPGGELARFALNFPTHGHEVTREPHAASPTCGESHRVESHMRRVPRGRGVVLVRNSIRLATNSHFGDVYCHGVKTMRTQRSISVVGCHAEGEIGDVIIGGVLPPAGETVFEMMQTMKRDHDHIRKMLICEPRGSVARHVNLIVPPKTPGCHAGAIIMEPTEYPPMSGSNTMCIATVLLETGMVPMTEPTTTLRLDMPGGVVEVVAECKDGKAVSIELTNVPCFVDRLDARLEVEGYGSLLIDIAYGGMFYAITDATKLGFAITPDEARELGELGERIRVACSEQFTDVIHPTNPQIRGVSIVQLNMPFVSAEIAVRNTCIVSPGRSDRSPTGTGTCARMAVLRARGQLGVGETLIHESIIGSRFYGRIVADTMEGTRPAIRPTVRGRAWITSMSTYLLDPTDPYPQGYLVADTWGRSLIMDQ